MKLKEILDKTTKFFQAKNFSSPRLDAELLLSRALSFDRMQLYLNFDKPLSTEEVDSCRELVARRGKGEPVAHILGQKEFYGYNFLVNSSVLIPRPETEHIIDEVLSWVSDLEVETENLKVVDLGTGSGCLAITLAKKLNNPSVTAVDVSEAALIVAKENAQLNEAKVEFICSDAMEIPESYFTDASIVVANPPYIDKNDPALEENVKLHEPSVALFSEENGMQHIKLWTRKCVSEIKKRPALMAFEIGSEQAKDCVDFLKELNISNYRIIKDYSGHDRVFLIQLED